MTSFRLFVTCQGKPQGGKKKEKKKEKERNQHTGKSVQTFAQYSGTADEGQTNLNINKKWP